MKRWLHTEFQDTFPVACIMKHRLPRLWMRVHSLPNSKRYPESDEERDIIFSRYALFGTALLGVKTPCYIVRSQFHDAELDAKARGSLDWEPLPAVRESEDEEPDGGVWHSWCAEVVWQPNRFRGLLLDVAEEQDSGVSFVAKSSGNMFAPYDGGSDGFSFDLALLKRLKHEFEPWLSPRDDGL